MPMNYDPYVYPGTDILKNKRNIKDEAALEDAEHKFSALRLNQLKITPIVGNFDYIHLQKIHNYIFQDIYEWAGKPRTVSITKEQDILKGRSINYPSPNNSFPPNNLAARAQYAFDNLKKDNYLIGLDKDQFIDKLTSHATEIWEVHPFRDGNTRAVGAFIKQLAEEAGHKMYGLLSPTRRALRDAFVLAADGKFEVLRNTISQSLEKLIALDATVIPYERGIKMKGVFNEIRYMNNLNS